MPYSRRHTGQRESAMTMFRSTSIAVCRLQRSIMHDRVFSSRVLLLIAVALPIAGCTNSQVDQLVVTPNAITMGIGPRRSSRPREFMAMEATIPSTTQDLTDSGDLDFERAVMSPLSVLPVWLPQLVPVSSTITASIHGFTGTLTAASTITVPASSGGGGSGGARHRPGHHPHIAICGRTH